MLRCDATGPVPRMASFHQQRMFYDNPRWRHAKLIGSMAQFADRHQLLAALVACRHGHSVEVRVFRACMKHEA